MYQKHSTISPGVLLPLFVAADAYQVLAVRRVCFQQLQDSITAENVLECFEMADACTAKYLMQACTQFIAQPGNSVLVARQPAMRKMMHEKPELVQELLVAVASSRQSHRKPKKVCCAHCVDKKRKRTT
ncbi:Broad-Complex, Tramtrack and Bric a brac [Trebouxia sp. C0010 RCD-2024]